MLILPRCLNLILILILRLPNPNPDPDPDVDHAQVPEPRDITLERHPELGFGFVAGSEKPVIVNGELM